jgi:hypothetical protein
VGNIKLYEDFKSDKEKISQIKEFATTHGIVNYNINDDYSIDINDNFQTSIFDKVGYMLPIKINKVKFSFNAYKSGIFSLNNGPTEVGGDYSCAMNNLKTLKGGPSKVGHHYDFAGNEIKSFKYLPEVINGGLFCGNNKIESFDYISKRIEGDLDISNNNITSFEGFPEVGGDIKMYGNPLFYLYNYFKNQPMMGEIRNNSLTDEELIEEFQEFEVIRGKNTILYDRLYSFLDGFGFEVPPIDKVRGIDGYNVID